MWNIAIRMPVCESLHLCISKITCPDFTSFPVLCACWLLLCKKKSFPSLTAHWAALISVPLALSQTPAYTAKTADTGPVHRAVCPFTPRRLGRYQIILLGDRGTWVWTTCPELLLDSGTAGIELTTCRSWVRRPNHYTTKPPLYQSFINNAICYVSK